MLDPSVFFKGTQQRGALPAQEKSSQKLPGVLDPYVLFLKEPGKEASPGEKLPEAAGGAGSLRPPYF